MRIGSDTVTSAARPLMYLCYTPLHKGCQHHVDGWSSKLRLRGGTQTQPLQAPDGHTFPASNKQVRLPGSTTLEIRQARIRRAWNYWDMGSLIGQIGPSHTIKPCYGGPRPVATSRPLPHRRKRT